MTAIVEVLPGPSDGEGDGPATALDWDEFLRLGETIPKEPQTSGFRAWLSRPFGPKGKALAVALLLAAVAVSAYILQIPPTEGMEMDGDFDDWDGAVILQDEGFDASTPEVDILGFAHKMDGTKLYFYVEVRGSMFRPTEGHGITVHIFIDSDGARSGYGIMRLGADHLIEVHGDDGAVIAAGYFRYTQDVERDPDGIDWTNWSFIDTVRAANDGRRMEVSMPYNNGDQGNFMIMVSDSLGHEDTTPVMSLKRDPGRAPIIVTADPVLAEGGSLDIGDHAVAEYDLLEVQVDTIGGTCRLDTMTIGIAGTATPSDIAFIEVLRDGIEVDRALVSGDAAVLDMEWTVLASETFDVRVRLSPNAVPGRVLSLGVRSVSAETKAITYNVDTGSWYIDTAADGHVVDGLFAEWTGAEVDIVGDATGRIDVTGFKAAREGGMTHFYVRVSGRMLAGDWVPETRPMVIAANGIPDNGTRPSPTGEDVIYAFLDVGAPSEGFRPEGFPITADRLIEVRGIDGRITGTTYYEYSPTAPEEWPWTAAEGAIDAASASSEIEFSLDLDLQEFRMVVHAVSWHNGSGDLTRPFIISALGGLDDPFAISLDGGVGWSASGEAWTQVGAAGEGAELVDIALSPDGSRAYALSSNGSVFSAGRGGDGWSHVEPSLPGGAYSAICTLGGSSGDILFAMSYEGAVLSMRAPGDEWEAFTDDSPTTSAAYIGMAVIDDPSGTIAAVLRNDGHVLRAVGGGEWSSLSCDGLPDGGRFCGIAAGPAGIGDLSLLAVDGEMFDYDGDRGSWISMGVGAGLPHALSYSSLTSGVNGTLYALLSDGRAFSRSESGWSPYGTGGPAPEGTDHAAISASTEGDGGVAILRTGGPVRWTLDAEGSWHAFCGEDPALPGAVPFVDIAADAGSAYALSADGAVSVSSDGGLTWSHLATSAGPASRVSIATGGNGVLYVLAADGGVDSMTAAGSVGPFGDCGDGHTWLSIATDGTFVYALARNGSAAFSPAAEAAWGWKGDSGDGLGWVSIDTAPGILHVYAMTDSREVSRSTSGASTTWTAWSGAGEDTSWQSVAVAGSTLFALRADGRVDVADIGPAPAWDETRGDAGGPGMEGIAAYDDGPAVPEVAVMVVIAPFAAAVIISRRRRSQR